MTVNFNSKTLEAYWLLLKNLSEDAKLELASRLINSLKPKKNPEKKESKNGILERLYGAWDDEEESAEEMVERIQKSRFSNREIESFD